MRASHSLALIAMCALAACSTSKKTAGTAGCHAPGRRAPA